MLNHVALLVHSVDLAAKFLAESGYHIGPRDVWAGEGTAEIYVGATDQTSRLLLMEPVKEGAYSRTMAKRGPGLHHIAIDVLDLEGFVDGLSGSGWYLHPKSLQLIKKSRTAWLARPGTAMLVEVQEQQKLSGAEPFVTRIEMPLTDREQKMMNALGVDDVCASQDSEWWLWFGQKRIGLKDILG